MARRSRDEYFMTITGARSERVATASTSLRSPSAFARFSHVRPPVVPGAEAPALSAG